MSKPWYKSKTLWANLALSIVAVIQADTGHLLLSANKEILIVAAINAGLRFITSQGIGGNS